MPGRPDTHDRNWEEDEHDFVWLWASSRMIIRSDRFDQVYEVYAPGNRVKHAQVSFQSGQIRVDGYLVEGSIAAVVKKAVHHAYLEAELQGRVNTRAVWVGPTK